jgi:hypothetical protein
MYILVYNPILSITNSTVTFATRNGEVFLKRIHDHILWKLTKDGIKVRKDYATAYRLYTSPICIHDIVCFKHNL